MIFVSYLGLGSSTIPKGIGVVRGRWDKSLQKWIRGGDIHEFVYEFPQQEDVGIRMGLNEFLEQCRAAGEVNETDHD